MKKFLKLISVTDCALGMPVDSDTFLLEILLMDDPSMVFLLLFSLQLHTSPYHKAQVKEASFPKNIDESCLL